MMKCQNRDEMSKYIITIDGPAGSGKSTIARELSKRLRANFLSSGKIYRTFAYFEMLYGYENAKEYIRKIKISCDSRISFENEDMDLYISSEDVGQRASELSRLKEVRDIVNSIQRHLVYNTPGSFIVEGRDEGTEVFKEADIKIFLEASLEERARRKYMEQRDKTYQYFLDKIRERDEMDSRRDISPMKVPEDAIVIDTTSKTIQEVVDIILEEIKKKKLHIFQA